MFNADFLVSRTRFVRGCAPNHFRETDRVLIEEHVRQTLVLQRAALEMRKNGAVVDGKISPWFQIQQRASKTLAVLATRLRLTPASRQHSKSVGRQLIPRHPPPWKQGGQEAGDGDA